MINSLKVPDDFMGKPIKGASEELEKKLEKESQIIQPTFEEVIDLESMTGEVTLSDRQLAAAYDSQIGIYKGKRMITAPDLYQVAKHGEYALLESIQKSFEKPLITRTVIKRISGSEAGEILHHLPNGFPIPLADLKAISELSKLIGDVDGTRYLQALFLTTDEPEHIERVVERLCNRESKDIVFCNPSVDVVYAENRLVFNNRHNKFLIISRDEKPFGVTHGVTLK